MEIKHSLVFPADPVTVYGMMTDPTFLEEVAAEAGATDCAVQVQGNVTTSRRSLKAPAEAQRFTGPTIKIVEEIAWSEADSDGSRTGRLTLTSPGQPMTMDGNVLLQPSGSNTEVVIQGDLKINIPLLGKKLEKVAAPALEDGIRAEERVGLRWLQK